MGTKDLLYEIWDHRLANGSCDVSYWEKRFEQLSGNFHEEILLRDRFGKLQEAKMIHVLWADDIPYIIQILDNGVSFMSSGKREERIMSQGQKPTIFISYNQATGSGFADSLEKKLQGKATILRDKNDIKPGESISRFMQSIRKQDFVVSVVTEKYMKSIACMYEMSVMMRESNWQDRVMIVLPEGFAYEKSEDYEKYWDEQRNELDKKIKENGISVDTLREESSRVKKIIAEIGDFIMFIKDRNNPPIWDILDVIEQRVIAATVSLPDDIPDEYRMLSELETAKTTLTKPAKDLLIAAKKARNRILCIKTLSGTQIALDGEKPFRDSMQADMLQEALLQLEQFEYVESDNDKREIFVVTPKGKTIAEKLEIESLLD